MWRGMNVSFRDLLFLLVFTYLVVGAVALANINKATQETTQGARPPGSLTVEMKWDDSVDADVDLWVQAPGDVPVGYSNKNGIVFNLVRDDLGISGEPIKMNYEVAYARGRWAGEYVVNVHLYRSSDHKLPIDVRIVVSSVDEQGRTTRLLVEDVKLMQVGQQLTVVRFTLDQKGEVVPGSVNHIFKQLREAPKQ